MDVEQKLPPRVETLVECELAPLQKKCYRALFERNFPSYPQRLVADDATIAIKEEENGENALSMFRNVMMEVRKCCQHPFLPRWRRKRRFEQDHDRYHRQTRLGGQEVAIAR